MAADGEDALGAAADADAAAGAADASDDAADSEEGDALLDDVEVEAAFADVSADGEDVDAAAAEDAEALDVLGAVEDALDGAAEEEVDCAATDCPEGSGDAGDAEPLAACGVISVAFADAELAAADEGEALDASF